MKRIDGKSSMKKAVVRFENFTFRYKAQKEPTLRDINLTVYEGEKVLILGASGCGKSTLINCINGLIPFSYPGAASGNCEVNGLETAVQSVFELSRFVGTVLQDSDAQFVGLSAGEDVAFSMENNNMPRGEMLPRVFELSAGVGMEQFLASLPFDLSGGQKQRIALAGVLGDEMNLLIFDEPLASLDPETGTRAIDLIDRMSTDAGRTVIIVEHRLEDVLYRRVDRVILMENGRIRADTVPGDLLRSGLLKECGIREPLYVTAMKYAGCSLGGIKNLEDLQNIEIPQAEEDKMRAFFMRDMPAAQRTYGPSAIEAKQVFYAYDSNRDGANVLEDISFSVRRGERVAVIGKNGAGKTTMARLICGIGKPKSGEIHIDGIDAKTLTVKEIGERVGYVMQNPNQMLVKDIILDEVELALVFRGLSKEEIQRKSRGALEICELYRMRNWPVDSVSYGQKKRVTVAAILALEPEVIILDEPTAGQDYRHYMEIIDFVNRLNAEYEKTIIFITHDMHLAIENTDRAIVFADGKIIADDSVFSVLSDDDIIKRANLKQTSLYTLAKKLGLEPEKAIESYIRSERSVRARE